MKGVGSEIETTRVIRGRNFASCDLATTRRLAGEYFREGRVRIATELAQHWQWRSRSGRLKVRAALAFLVTLERGGHLQLPPPLIVHGPVRDPGDCACATPPGTDLTEGLSQRDLWHWQSRKIAEGEKGPIVAGFARVRVYLSRQRTPESERTLLLRNDPDGRIKYALSNAPESVALSELIRVSAARWPIERCFQEDKSELDLDHCEHRSWAAWHRHIRLVFLAHLFLTRLRLTFPISTQDHSVHPPQISRCSSRSTSWDWRSGDSRQTGGRRARKTRDEQVVAGESRRVDTCAGGWMLLSRRAQGVNIVRYGFKR